MDDLNAATVPDAEGFFRTYYAPNNAVLSLVGNFKTARALALIKKYFENIPAQTPPGAPDVSEPEQKGERRKVLEDSFAQTPRLDLVYKIPPGNTSDWYALEVLGNVLSNGVSSRLYQKFVKEKELAISVSADASEQRGPALFWFSVMARPTTDLAELEKLLVEEISRVQAAPVRDAELGRVRMQLRRQRAQQLYSSRARANALGHFAVYYNDPSLINKVWDKYDQVSPADVQKAAQKYFIAANRSVITTIPKPTGAAGAR
jgi:predicted Zn-dependent peptidase